DMVMPVMGGSECIRGLKEINPDVRIILSTGYSRETVADQINSSELSGFLPKPYGRQQLSRAIADILQTQVRH
ncbi:MAG: response regulator, partial [Pseudomonadota bacterium]